MKPKDILVVIAPYMAVFALYLSIQVAISNRFQVSTLPAMTSVFLKLRMLEAKEKFPVLLDNEKKSAVFWGASEVESALSPPIINNIFSSQDPQNTWESFNLGMRSVHPLTYLLFAESIANEVQKQNKRIHVSFIKVPINKLTTKFENKYTESEQADQIGAILTWPSKTLLNYNPLLYLKVVMNHFAFGDASTNVLRTIATDHISEISPPAAEKRLKKFFSIWHDKKFIDGELWSRERHGEFQWGLPSSSDPLYDALERKKQPRIEFEGFLYFERCCGYSTLELSPRLIQQFIDLIKTVQKVSDHVVIYQIPETTRFHRWRQKDYAKKQTIIYKEIRRQTGLKVIDFGRSLELRQDDYIDFLHLSPEGQDLFYSALLNKFLQPVTQDQDEGL